MNRQVLELQLGSRAGVADPVLVLSSLAAPSQPHLLAQTLGFRTSLQSLAVVSLLRCTASCVDPGGRLRQARNHIIPETTSPLTIQASEQSYPCLPHRAPRGFSNIAAKLCCCDLPKTGTKPNPSQAHSQLTASQKQHVAL